MTAAGPPDPRLARAQSAHRAGDRATAEALYRQCLEQGSARVPAALLLAQLLGETGRLGEAENVLEPVLDAGGPPARLLMARVQLGLGRPEACRGLLRHGDRFPPALADDAALLRSEALEALGQADEARGVLEEAAARHSEHPVLWNRLGVLRHAAGDAAGAVDSFRRSLSRRPGHAGVRANLAAALAETGDARAAGELFRTLLDDVPGHRQASLGYAGLLKELGDLDGARGVLGQLAGDPESDPEALTLAASLAQAAGDAAAAERDYAAALAADPNCSPARAGLAELYEWTGRYERGLASLGQRGPDESPQTAIARARLLGRLDRHAEAARVLAGIGDAGSLHRSLRRRLAFTRGDVLDRLGRYEEALSAYAEGNALNPAEWDPGGPHVIPSALPVPEAELRESGEAGSGVVLIVGMPRSGTTLVEQILAAHPAVIPGGERVELGRIAARVAAGGSGSLAGLRAAYRETPVPEGKRFTDKMPLNFQHLDLASVLLPGARVVHCRRDPRDTAVSCFATDFIDPALAFARRWDWLAAFTRRYEAHMDEWRKAPALATLELDYEGLVADPETGIRRLLAFLDLPWDPACLDFHRLGRSAATASHAQVRRPVHTSSVGRWRHYADWLPGDILGL